MAHEIKLRETLIFEDKKILLKPSGILNAKMMIVIILWLTSNWQ